MANAILQGAGAENQDYLQSINRIGRMSDDALGMMGGTVMRDAQGNPILDEAGRPQFGGGIFGNYAQDLLSQERDMGAGAQFNAIDQLQLADETALQGLQLAEFLGVDPSTFAAGQYAGVDVGSLQAGRDASAAATAEAELDRALRRELSTADITSREDISAAEILSREGIASDKAQLSRDLSADDLAVAIQKLTQDSGQYREQTIDNRELDRQKMELATEQLALDQAQLDFDQIYDMAVLNAQTTGQGMAKGYLANAISSLAMNPDYPQEDVTQLIKDIKDTMDLYGQSALTNENIQMALAQMGKGDLLVELMNPNLNTGEVEQLETIGNAAAAETTTTTTTETADSSTPANNYGKGSDNYSESEMLELGITPPPTRGELGIEKATAALESIDPVTKKKYKDIKLPPDLVARITEYGRLAGKGDKLRADLLDYNKGIWEGMTEQDIIDEAATYDTEWLRRVKQKQNALNTAEWQAEQEAKGFVYTGQYG
tara:strand:- start:1569 stop:3038 length:1470 start_codon:yes stop_codon:yes gene_type:complete